MRATIVPVEEPMAVERRPEGAARRPTLRPSEGVTTTGVDFLDEGARMKACVEEFKDVKT